MNLFEIRERCIKLAEMSNCLRMHFGAVIFKNGVVLSEGFNYPVLGACKKECIRDKMDVHHGRRLELCYAVHAEQEAICSAARRGIPIAGADIMVVGMRPSGELLWREKTQFYCSVCARLLIASRLRRIFGVTKEGFVVVTPDKAMGFAMDVAMGKKSYDAHEK